MCKHLFFHHLNLSKLTVFSARSTNPLSLADVHKCIFLKSILKRTKWIVVLLIQTRTKAQAFSSMNQLPNWYIFHRAFQGLQLFLRQQGHGCCSKLYSLLHQTSLRRCSQSEGTKAALPKSGSWSETLWFSVWTYWTFASNVSIIRFFSQPWHWSVPQVTGWPLPRQGELAVLPRCREVEENSFLQNFSQKEVAKKHLEQWHGTGRMFWAGGDSKTKEAMKAQYGRSKATLTDMPKAHA